MSWDGINPVYMFKVGCAQYYSMAELGLKFIVLLMMDAKYVRNM